MLRLGVILMVSAIVAGCSKSELPSIRFTGDFCELATRQEKFEQGEETIVGKLKDDDVLVAVNGYPLTKKMFDELMLIKTNQISKQKDSNNPFMMNQLSAFKKNFIRLFVNQRLLIDKARELGVMSQAELEKKVNDIISSRAKARNISVEQYVKSFPGDFKYHLYELAEMLLMDRLIVKHIPPEANVDDEVVAAFQKSIEDDNAAFAKTNEMKRARMLVWKNDILAKKISFEALARKYNEDEDADSEKPGYWGEFERGQFEDKKIQSVVFNMKVGEISDPVEDDDGYHLIKLLSIKEPERNSRGRLIQDEVRSVMHVFVKKVPLFIHEPDDVMMGDLKRQMQLQAINKYLADIKTNGVTRIEFPHGKKLFE